MVETNIFYCHDSIEERIKKFEYKSTEIPVNAWHGSLLVEKVLDVDTTAKVLKSEEDVLMNRLDVWIDMCRVQKKNDKKSDRILGITDKPVTARVKRSKSFYDNRPFSICISPSKLIVPSSQDSSSPPYNKCSMRNVFRKKMRRSRSSNEIDDNSEEKSAAAFAKNAATLPDNKSISLRSLDATQQIWKLKERSRSIWEYINVNVFRKKSDTVEEGELKEDDEVFLTKTYGNGLYDIIRESEGTVV